MAYKKETGGNEKERTVKVRHHDVWHLDEPGYTVAPEYSRMRERDTVYRRVENDKNFPLYGKLFTEHMPEKLERDGPGYTRADHALFKASRSIYEAMIGAGAFSEERTKRRRPPEEMPAADMAPREAASVVKRAARFFGAGNAGITRVDRRWLYAPNEGDDERVPEELRYAVVMTFPMDAQAIATSPALPSAAASGFGYTRMLVGIVSIAEFIRDLGYRALPSGNDTGLNIPMAVDAGLGELGRNGMLLTPQRGPMQRIGKVFTDMPMETDSPVSFGAHDYCVRCKQCATACDANAISYDAEPSFEPSPTSNPFVLKWHVDAEKCFSFWFEQGSDCSTCISVCPLNDSAYGRGGQLDPEVFWNDDIE